MDDAAPPPMPWPEDVAALRQRVAHLEAALTAQQDGAQALREAKDAAEHIVETVRDPLLVLTSDFRVQSANPAFYQLFQVRPAETAGQSIYQLGNGQWDIPALHTLLEEILPQNTVFNDYEVTHDFEHIGPRTILLNARRLDHVDFILLAMEDITACTQAEAILQEHQAQLERQVQEQTAALYQEMAERHGEPSSSGFTPRTARAYTLSARSGSRKRLSVARAQVASSNPARCIAFCRRRERRRRCRIRTSRTFTKSARSVARTSSPWNTSKARASRTSRSGWRRRGGSGRRASTTA